jgi:hypothetical protein
MSTEDPAKVNQTSATVSKVLGGKSTRSWMTGGTASGGGSLIKNPAKDSAKPGPAGVHPAF